MENMPSMGAVRHVDGVNTPNRKPQVTDCTKIDQTRSKQLLETLMDTESRGSSPLSSTFGRLSVLTRTTLNFVLRWRFPLSA